MITFSKKFELNTPSWDEILFDLNYSVQHKELIKNTSPGFFVSHYAYRIPRVKLILDKLNLKEAHSYINILYNSPTFGEHKDTMDVWFWQVKGKTKWIIENQNEYTLNEGDLIYVPKGTLHNVIPLGPRVGISMSL
jgi:mannose-6-phosphate isomerase-like protein (cupin superfamily)